MKHVIAAVALSTVLASAFYPVMAQESGRGAAPATLASITLPHKVMANGQALAAGTYQVRLTSDQPAPVVGQSPEGARYVEFLQAGKVVGREVATVVSNADMQTMAKGRKPAANGAMVQTLKGADYMRVWINRGGNNYLIHLPPA